MAGPLGLLGQRLCTNRSDNQMGAGFAHLGHALVQSSSNVEASVLACERHPTDAMSGPLVRTQLPAGLTG
jgi:hypothetical protein